MDIDVNCTIVAFLISVEFLIFPYLLLSDPFISLLLIVMNTVILILILNYNLAVAKDIHFRRRGSETLAISMRIAAPAFVINHIVMEFLHLGLRSY